MAINKFTPSKLDIKISKQICEWRIANGLSQEEFAKKLGINKNTLNKYEKAMASIPASDVFEIAKIMKIPIAEFFPKFHHEIKGCIGCSWFDPL